MHMAAALSVAAEAEALLRKRFRVDEYFWDRTGTEKEVEEKRKKAFLDAASKARAELVAAIIALEESRRKTVKTACKDTKRKDKKTGVIKQVKGTKRQYSGCKHSKFVYICSSDDTTVCRAVWIATLSVKPSDAEPFGVWFFDPASVISHDPECICPQSITNHQVAMLPEAKSTVKRLAKNNTSLKDAAIPLGMISTKRFTPYQVFLFASFS